MKKKVKNSLPKRIAAFVMALLMVLSLMPIDPSVFYAAEEYTFTFIVKDSEPIETLNEITVEMFEVVDDTRTLLASGTTSAEGIIAVSALQFEDSKTSADVVDGGTYEFVSEGYETSSVTISDEENVNKEYTVEMIPTENEPTTKEDPQISFDMQSVEVINGKYLLEGFDFSEATLQSDLLGAEVENGVKYSTDSNLITIDEDTGEVTFVDIKDASQGTVEITIVATREEDATYRQSSVSYTIKVVDWTPTDAWEDIYSITEPHVNGWYSKVDAESPISVTIKDGKEYVIFVEVPTKETINTGTTTYNITSLQDGNNQEISFYIMDASGAGNGYISGKHTISGIKVDTTASISVKKDNFTLLDYLLNFFKWEQHFVVEADESASTNTIFYYVADGAVVVEKNDGETEAEAIERVVAGNWVPYSEAIVFSADQKNVIYAKVEDEAGNKAYAHTNGLITDNTAPEISVIEPNAVNGYYTDDFSIEVDATDSLSGIKELYYQIGSTDAQKYYLVQNTVLDNTTENDLVYDTSNLVVPSIDIVVNDDINTPEGVTVYIVAVDNSGNATTIPKNYKICKETPEIQVVFDNNAEKKEVSGIKYYDAIRTATITIVSRNDVFDANNVIITLNGQVVNCTWNGQVASVPVTADGENTLSVEYSNTIGNDAETFSETFLIDTDVPSGVVTLTTDTDSKEWETWLQKLTFGIWKNTDISVSATANADTTDVSIQYYVSNEEELLTTDELDALADVEWTNYTESLAFNSEEIYAVYFKLVDEVGNKSYLSTDGFVVDMHGGTIELTPNSDPNANGYYNSDITFTVSVRENADNYSGIDTITYWVVCDGQPSEKIEIYNFDKISPIYSELVECKEDVEFTIDAETYSNKNVVVYAEVKDNAGNVTTTAGHALKINTVAPKVEISYDNNNATGYDGLTYYFDSARIATIFITDKTGSFDTVAATNAIQVTLEDKAENTVVDNGVVIGAWEEVSADTYKATVSFTKDGYYTLTVDYTDKSDLSNGDRITPVQSTVAPKAFAIDTVEPDNVTVSVLNKAWDEFLERITFGLYTSENVVLTITGEDVTSNIVYEYYISNLGQNLDIDALRSIADEDWTACNGTTIISKEQQMAIYVRVTDQAGNRVYVNTDGVVLDKTAAGITLTSEGSCTNGIFRDDVAVKIFVDDTAITSGIKNVEYWITCDGTETYRETLYTFNNNAPLKTDLKQNFNATITVDAQENNSSNVVVYVKVTDNAGNVSTKSLPLDIDIVAPAIEVSYDNNDVIEISNGRGYFNAIRTATIIVTERSNHFDKDALINQIDITAEDAKGNALDTAIPTVVYEKTVPGETADTAQHIFKVTYSADANYTFDITYTDKAGWKCDSTKVNYGTAVSPKGFTVDTVAPSGKITAGKLGVWESLIQTITFGLWTPDEIDIVITSDDVTSPIKKVEYYKTTTFTALNLDALKDVTSWVEADKVKVSTDDIFVVYAKITDMAGHVQYISTNGIIVDETKPVFESLSPEITITPERPVNGIYDGNVRVDVGVIDPKVGANNAYSGIRNIRYEVYSMGVKTQEGTLYNFTETNPTQNKLLQSWNEQDIVVDASRNNSNEVVVKVVANDNVGNYSEKEITLMIDTTKPVVEVSYDNNNGDTTFEDGVYYNANRVATIKVTERNFDAKYVNVVITNTDGVIPNISNWTTQKGSGNGDNTVHTATITYTADGDYTFAVSVKDKGGNACNGVNYGESQAPTAFTIDKTAPVILIAYDNNDFVNGNYYKADRVATITINEHNFDASRVVTAITATDDGQTIAAPVISNWNKSGDTYTATVNYATDALYTFDISYNDKAGNAAADFAEQSFYVDKTMPQMSITEIVDQSANNKDKIGLVITATDTNFDMFNPVLTAVIKTENGFTTQELNIASVTDITNGRVYTIENIDADGIYRIKCTLVDKAGNAYTAVTLQHEDGTTYVEERSAEDTLLSFSVNRDGSVFEVDEVTKEVLDNYYVYDVKEDIVIIEVNADSLTSNAVSLNGKELVEGSDYTVATEGGNGAWMRYSYTLNKDLFVEEGEYTIVVSSVDKAENNAFSDVKNTKVAFVVDRTAPVVTISGLESNGRYQTDAQSVTLLPTDDGGAVKSITVNQVDENGNVVKVLQPELSGDALEEVLNAKNGQIIFDIPSGQYEYIEIICSDSSVNTNGTTNVSEILIENVLITENPVEIFWATYQYAIIGGGAAAVAIPTGVVLFRRRIKIK